MSAFTIIRCLIVRFVFVFHSLVVLWRLYATTQQARSWLYGLSLVALAVETFVIIKFKNGKEWKWFCPSVFLYLITVVPPIWHLELHQVHKRVDAKYGSHTTGQIIDEHDDFNSTTDDQIDLGFLGVKANVSIQIAPNQWLLIIEQGLLLVLILGRWCMPKGQLTHDQLSQLLLVYIGTAADIVEFFDAFKEEIIVDHSYLSYAILSLWSWSLLQFCLVLTATKSRQDKGQGIGVSDNAEKSNRKTLSEEQLMKEVWQVKRPDKFRCCTPDVYGTIFSIMLQDLPYFIFRLILIFLYKVSSYSNFFFTAKNGLIITLLTYRLVVVQCERKQQVDGAAVDYFHLREKSSHFNNMGLYKLAGGSKSCPGDRSFTQMFSSDESDVDSFVPEHQTGVRFIEHEHPSSPSDGQTLKVKEKCLLRYSPIFVRKAPRASLDSLSLISNELFYVRKAAGRLSRCSTPSTPLKLNSQMALNPMSNLRDATILSEDELQINTVPNINDSMYVSSTDSNANDQNIWKV